MKKKYILLVVLGIMLVASLSIGVSYSLWTQTVTQTGENIVESGCFTTKYTETNLINLTNAYPISDTKGMALTPATFTIENTCTIASNYVINLERLSTTTMGADYVKVAINEKTPQLLSAYTSETDPTITDALSAHTLATGKLTAGGSVTYTLRMWIDNDATTTNVAGKKTEAKIVVSQSATE